MSLLNETLGVLIPIDHINAWIAAINAATAALAAPPVVLLHASSGSDASAGATNVDTYALASQLTLKDTLIIQYTLEAVTQDTVQPVLYNVTDSLAIQNLYGTPLVAGTQFISNVEVRRLQSSTTKVAALRAASVDSTPAGIVQSATYSTFTTVWTGAWTIALRHGGVTAGGSLKWSWAIHVLKGQ